MNLILLKRFTVLCVTLFFYFTVKAQIKQDSISAVPSPLLLVPEKGYPDRSVYKFDSASSRMPVIPLKSNDRMPIAKLSPFKNHSGVSLKLDSLKKAN